MTAEHLAFNRERVEEMMTDTATVRTRSGGSSDGMGGTKSYTWADAGTVPCRVQAFRPRREVDGDGKVMEEGTFRISVPWDASVTADDRLVVDGVTYELSGSNIDQTERYALHFVGVVSE